MRRSELLSILAGKSPCLLCHLPIVELVKCGKGDAAFLLPDLTRAIWETAGIAESDRVALNEMLSELIRCPALTTQENAGLLSVLRPEILRIAGQTQELNGICVEFLTLLDVEKPGMSCAP